MNRLISTIVTMLIIGYAAYIGFTVYKVGALAERITVEIERELSK